MDWKTDMKGNRTIRKLVDDDFDNFIEIWAHAYPGAVPDNFTKEIRRQKKDEWIKTNNENNAINYYGCFQKETLVGGMILYDFQMNYMNLFSSNIIDCGGVGEVCVDLLYKKEHIAKDLMIFAHNHYYNRGYCLICLYPFAPDFYAKMGYGIGNKMNQYRFEPKSLERTSKGNISYLSESDIKSLSECFNRYAASTHGMILRSENSDAFKHMLGNMKVIGYWDNGNLMGYLAFRMKNVDGGSWLQYDIHIMEFVYETPKALHGLLTFLATQQDQIHRILYNTHDHHFHHLLQEPRSRGNENIFHIFQESNIQGVGIMYRVINVPKFFQVLNDHNFGDQTVKLKMTIIDNFLPNNEGNFTVHFHNGTPNVVFSEENYDVEITLDIARFSSLIIGAITFKRLYEYGLVQITDKSYVNLLTKLFLTNEAPFTFEPF